MKNIVIISFVFALLFTSCTQTSDYERVKQLNDSLILESSVKKMLIGNLFSSILNMDESLVAMDSCLNVLLKTSDTVARRTTAQQLTTYFEKSENLRIDLSEYAVKLQNEGVVGGALGEIIDSYTKKLERKNIKWSLLRDSLSLSSIQIVRDTLVEQYNEPLNTLNTTYYLAMSESELLSKGVILRPGFIGQQVEINPDANLQEFNKANMQNFTELSFEGKKFKLLTSHPATSYSTDYDKQTGKGVLIIKNKEKFWANSRILVISYK